MAGDSQFRQFHNGRGDHRDLRDAPGSSDSLPGTHLKILKMYLLTDILYGGIVVVRNYVKDR